MRIDRRAVCGALLGAALLIGCDVSSSPTTPNPAAPSPGTGQPPISVTSQPPIATPVPVTPTGGAYPAYPVPTAQP
jgi:hypothetical protein